MLMKLESNLSENEVRALERNKRKDFSQALRTIFSKYEVKIVQHTERNSSTDRIRVGCD